MANFDISTNDDTVNSYVLDRLSNFGVSAEGAVLPPIQKGESRVPFASGVQVVSAAAQGDSTTFSLRWVNVANDPTLKVDHYNIYYSLGTSNQPVGPFIAQQSPANVVVHTVTPTPVTFYIQTVLANGMTSPLFGSPTAAANSLTSQLSPDAIASVSSSLMSFTLLQGYTLQPVVTALAGDITITQTTNLLTCNSSNAPKGGALLSLGVVVRAPTGLSSSTVNIRLTIDGGTPFNLPIYGGSTKWATGGITVATSTLGAGDTALDHINFNVAIGFTSTLLVDWTAVSAGGGPYTVDFGILWAAKN